MAIKFRKPSWVLTLFSLPFLGVGLGFLFMSIIPTLYLGVMAPQWHQAPVTLLSASLDVSYGDSTTYQAKVSYQYEFQGKTYSSNRVGINRGNDNIGQWQKQKGSVLKRNLANNVPMVAFVNPKNPDTAMLFPDIRWGLIGLKMIFVVIFGGVGGLLFVGSIIEMPNSLSRFKKTNSKVKQEAQSEHIYSSARSAFWVLLGSAIFVSAISSPVLFSIADEWRSGNKVVLLALIFPVIGLGLFLATIREGYRLRKFGRSPLVLSPFPAGLGGYLGATVLINSDYQSQHRYKVALSCIHRYTTRSGGKSKTNEETRWHEEGMAYAERAQHNKTLLRFNFNIPENQPASSEEDGHQHYWKIDVESQVSGLKFKRSFTVPVLAVENPAPTTRYLAPAHPGMVELTVDRIEALEVQDRGTEIEVEFPRFSHPSERLGGVAFGGVFVGSGIGVSMAGAPFIFPLLFVPIGGIILIMSLIAFLSAHQVLIRADGVYRRSSFIGLIKKDKRLLAADITALSINKASTWESSHGPKRYFFSIEGKSREGKKIQLIDRIEGKDAAQALFERFNAILRRSNK